MGFPTSKKSAGDNILQGTDTLRAPLAKWIILKGNRWKLAYALQSAYIPYVVIRQTKLAEGIILLNR